MALNYNKRKPDGWKTYLIEVYYKDVNLGYIKWATRYRRYRFTTITRVSGVLRNEVEEYIKELMKERKNEHPN